MRLHNYRLGWMLPAIALTVVAASSSAQPAGAGPQASGTAGGTSAAPSDARVGFQRRVQLTPAEEVAQSQAIVARMEAAATTVQHQLEEARGQRDVVKTLCLNDKLSQADVAVRAARERVTSLGLAARRNDAELANHEFTVLSVLRQRSEQLTAEANQCIGEESAFANASSVTSSHDPNLPSGDDVAGYPSANFPAGSYGNGPGDVPGPASSTSPQQ